MQIPEDRVAEDRVADLGKLVWPSAHAPKRLTLLLLRDVLAALQCLKGLLTGGNLLGQAGELRCSRSHELLLLVHGFSCLWRQLQLGAQTGVPARGQADRSGIKTGGWRVERMVGRGGGGKGAERLWSGALLLTVMPSSACSCLCATLY